MNLKELLAAAKAAVAEGDVEKARRLTEQAEALKAIEALTPPVEDDATKAVKAENESLKAKLAEIEKEPPVVKASGVKVTDDEADKKARRPFKSFGEQLKAVADAALHPYKVDERLNAQKALLGNNETISSDGGFLVQTDFAAEIFSVEHSSGVIAPRCRRIGVGANANGLKMNAIAETSRATGSRWGGIRGYWVAEGSTITASNPEFRQMELNLNKIAAAVYATEELLQDTTALGSVIQQGVSEELSFMLDDSIINGTGAGQPLGVLNSAALISVAKETGQDAATIVYENVLKMWARAHARSRMSPNMVWLINQDIEPQLHTMTAPVGTGGLPVYLPPSGLSGSPYATLMGKPVIASEFNATLGTVGDIMLVDLSQYLLIDKGGTQAASSMHVQFLTDQMVYRFTYRVDGQPLWNSALTPYKGSNTQSPYIALATRS